MNLVEWSLAVEAGLRRPPLIRCNGKAPLDRDWPTGPFDEPDKWRNRLVRHKGNVGMVCGRGLAVLDVDLYKPPAEGSLDALVAATKLDLATITGITGRGGRHYVYSYDPELSVPSIPLEPRGFPGIELKADGGMVIVPPSVHPDTGRPYCWEEGYGPGDLDDLTFPPEFLVLIGAVKGGSRERSRHWQPLDEELAPLDPADVEAARILVEQFGGHHPVLLHGGTIGVFRPGKTDGSASITVGFIGPGVGKVWTDGWSPFRQGQVVDLGQLRSMAGLTPQIEIPEVVKLPPGYRFWREGDDDQPPPVLAPAAYHGPIGRYLRLVEGETEGHPAAIGAMLLTRLGCLIGRRAQIWNGEHFHHANLFTLIPGKTSTGAKGVADNTVRLFMGQVEPAFRVRHVVGGFGSGEALLDDIRDVDDDQEPVEKWRVVIEPEFARVLQVARREHNILSVIIRNAFDYEPIRHRTKSHGLVVATGHHVSVEGSITPAELVELSAELDLQNGWLNRFMFFHSALTAILPFGGSIDRGGLAEITADVRRTLEWLGEQTAVNGVGRLYYVLSEDKAKTRDGKALARLYDPWYRSVRAREEPGSELTCRQHVHVPRIMLILAVLDRAERLTVEHFEAAKAWNNYSVATAERLFARSSRPGKIGQLLEAIREAGSDGLDGTAQVVMFKNTLDSARVARLRAELEAQQLIVTTAFPTGGRPRLVSFAIYPAGSK